MSRFFSIYFTIDWGKQNRSLYRGLRYNYIAKVQFVISRFFFFTVALAGCNPSKWRLVQQTGSSS